MEDVQMGVASDWVGLSLRRILGFGGRGWGGRGDQRMGNG